MGTMGIYKPLYVWCSPASIPQIVAHIQDYLVKNPIVSTETVAEIVVQSLQEHPELINGSVIPITEDSAQTIKEYIDALPLLDGYTKAETDALLLLKQNLLIWDQTPTAGSSNPVTSEGIKAAISATAAALADLISTKADIASVYTKSVMDTLLLQKADVATTYSKNAVDALLDTKVDINDTYTKADIDLMKQVDKANTAIVSSTDGTAPLNIAAGQYVYLNDILYMATQAIPEDDPLVPGTNIVLTPKGVANNIGDGLQALSRTVGEQSDQIAYLQNGYYLEYDSLNALKADLPNKVMTIVQNNCDIRLLKIRPLFSDDIFEYASLYVGFITNVDSGVYFNGSFISEKGKEVIISYANGTWSFVNVTADSGVQTLSVAPYGNSPISYHKVGKTVSVIVTSQEYTNLTAGTETTIATLPLGYRPRETIVLPNSWGGYVVIQSGGAIRISSATTTQWVSAVFTYIVD